ncbi:MAG: hypothetical protein LH467_06680 [Gemmatimonadaceae bacterium]|nr:hypothetical protein [Gemmatimonadaceae bacterium]
MNLRGVGDRWLADELVAGVTFAHHQPVLIADGIHRGQRGIIVLLVALTPEPRYLVRLADAREIQLGQSALHPAA